MLLIFGSILFLYFSLIWYRWIRQNGRRYQHVLALCALLIGVVLKALTFRKFVLMFVYVCFVLCLLRDWVCGLTWEKVYIWEEFRNVHLLMTLFDCPEVTLSDWRGDKIQLLTCFWPFTFYIFLYPFHCPACHAVTPIRPTKVQNLKSLGPFSPSHDHVTGCLWKFTAVKVDFL